MSVDRYMGRGLLLDVQGQTVASRPAFTHAGHGEGGEVHFWNFLDKHQKYYGKLYALKFICQANAQKFLMQIFAYLYDESGIGFLTKDWHIQVQPCPIRQGIDCPMCGLNVPTPIHIV